MKDYVEVHRVGKKNVYHSQWYPTLRLPQGKLIYTLYCSFNLLVQYNYTNGKYSGALRTGTVCLWWGHGQKKEGMAY